MAASTNMFQIGAQSKLIGVRAKSATSTTNAVFAAGTLVAVDSAYAEDWWNISPVATNTPLHRIAIVGITDPIYVPRSYIVYTEGVVGVSCTAGMTFDSPLLYDVVAKKFTTTSNANTLNVSARLVLEQVAGTTCSVQFI